MILLPLPSVSAQENRIYELGLWDLQKEKEKNPNGKMLVCGMDLQNGIYVDIILKI